MSQISGGGMSGRVLGLGGHAERADDDKWPGQVLATAPNLTATRHLTSPFLEITADINKSLGVGVSV